MPINLDKPLIDLIRQYLKVNADVRERMVRLHNLAQASERGIDITKGVRWDAVNAKVWAGRDRIRLHQWALWGKPKKIATAVMPLGKPDAELEWIALDPPIVLDDPATLKPVLFRE